MDDAKRCPSISVPSIPLKPSATSRHELLRVKPGTHVKRINSIALPGIDTRHEIRLIQDGHAERVGDSRYRINGRVYVHKPDGSTYPESGEGIVRLTNPQFRALRLLIAHDGRTVAFNRATERDKSITDLDIEVAHGLYQLRKGSMP